MDAIEKILIDPRVTGLLEIKYEKLPYRKVHYVGKGRGSKNRKQFVTKKIRYSISSVGRYIEPIADAKERFGFSAFVTSAT